MLPKTTLFAARIDPTGIQNFLDASKNMGNDLHAILLIRDGKIAYEQYFDPYQKEDKRHVFSISKSWTATAVGLAVAEGRFSLSDPVISFFPEECPAVISENLAAMTVRDLLRMGTGHHTEPPVMTRTDVDWVRGFLSYPVEHVPGTHFAYNSLATYILAAILKKQTGEDLVTYLTPRLFEPLGITGIHWDHSPQGICCGGWGIHVSAEDIAKLGLLYLNGGIYNGRRILSEEWVHAATSKQIDNAPNSQIDWGQGYGYQIWRCQHDCFRFDGAFGQYMIAVPQKNALAVIFSQTVCMQDILDAFWEHLLPAFDHPAGNSPVPDHLCAPIPHLSGRCFEASYQASPNEWGILGLKIYCDFEGGNLLLQTKWGENNLPFKTNHWETSRLLSCPVFPDMVDASIEPMTCDVGAAGGWQNHTLQITVRYRNTPHKIVWELDTDLPAFHFQYPQSTFSGDCPNVQIALSPLS
jgi:hypothetical protein